MLLASAITAAGAEDPVAARLVEDLAFRLSVSTDHAALDTCDE